jgi:hypothetical protein
MAGDGLKVAYQAALLRFGKFFAGDLWDSYRIHLRRPS